MSIVSSLSFLVRMLLGRGGNGGGDARSVASNGHAGARHGGRKQRRCATLKNLLTHKSGGMHAPPKAKEEHAPLKANEEHASPKANAEHAPSKAKEQEACKLFAQRLVQKIFALAAGQF